MLENYVPWAVARSSSCKSLAVGILESGVTAPLIVVVPASWTTLMVTSSLVKLESRGPIAITWPIVIASDKQTSI